MPVETKQPVLILGGFKILRENVLEHEQRKQLQEIRQTLQAIEDGKAINV